MRPATWWLARREWASYFATPVALVYLMIFVALAGTLTIFVGDLFGRGQADLEVFFALHPWLYLIFVPAVTMRLWAEEERQGTAELLLTLPLTTGRIVLAKFLAAWAFVGLALMLTAPLWAIVAYLGEPDHGTILAGYIGSLLMAGSYAAVGLMVSTLTRSQAAAFILATAICFVLTAAGSPILLEATSGRLPPLLVETLGGVSFLGRFDAISRGVVDLRDVFFFVSIGAAFLFCAIGVIEARKGPVPTLRLPLMMAALAIAALAANVAVLVGLPGLRFDLTEDRRHTLSAVTRSVLAEIDEVITLRLYISAALVEQSPAFATLSRRLDELLAELGALAGGRLVVERIDPAPFSLAEDRAVAEGLVGIPFGADGTPAYFGLVGRNRIDRRAAVPFLTPGRDADLEYLLARMVRRLAILDPPRLAVISGLPFLGGAVPEGLAEAGAVYRPFAMAEDLSGQFDLIEAAPAELAEIPDLDALLVIHPNDLSESDWADLTAALAETGRAALFVDPFSEAEVERRPSRQIFARAGSTLGPIGPHLGVRLREEAVVLDPAFAAEVDAGDGAREIIVAYPAWLRLPPAQLSRTSEVTADIDILALGSVGALSLDPPAGLVAEVLVRSSKDAMLIDHGAIAFQNDPEALMADYRAGDTALPLAVRLSGSPPPALAGAAADLDVVITADTDLLDDRFWRDGGGRRHAFNDLYLLAIAEMLTETPRLSGLKGRSETERPFTRLLDLQRQADATYRTTEAALVRRLEELRARLGDPEAAGAANASERAETVRQMRAELLGVRRELRQVRRQLFEDVEDLRRKMVFVAVGLAPALIACVALIWWAAGRLRRRRPPIRAGGA